MNSLKKYRLLCERESSQYPPYIVLSLLLMTGITRDVQNVYDSTYVRFEWFPG